MKAATYIVSEEAESEIINGESPNVEKIDWKREPHLRKLYAYAAVLMVAAATTGYDG